MKLAKCLSSVLIATLLFPLPLAASLYTSSSSFVHPRIASGQMTIHSACMMPARGKLKKLGGLKRPETMASESDAWSETLQKAVENHLKAAGVEISAAEGNAGSDSSDAEVQQRVVGVQQKYDAISVQVQKHPKEIGKSGFTIGNEVAQLPCASKADVLAFVDAQGEIVTRDRAELGAVFRAGPTNNTAEVFVTLVDAKSGEVVGFLRISHVYHRDSIYDPDNTYGKYLDKEFQNMKLGTAGAKP